MDHVQKRNKQPRKISMGGPVPPPPLPPFHLCLFSIFLAQFSLKPSESPPPNFPSTGGVERTIDSPDIAFRQM